MLEFFLFIGFELTMPMQLNKNIQPRKFLYEEMGFNGCYLIEWKNSRLELQTSSPCIPFVVDSEEFVIPTDVQWKQLKNDLGSLELEMTKYRDETSLEDKWFESQSVECWITFERRILKLQSETTQFPGFDKLRYFINRLTVSSEYPRGFLKTA